MPIVIGHRGAAGHRPEHTLAGYALAIDQGADFIEPDLVSTRDGVLIARHDAELSLTTDVGRRPQFAARRRTQMIDGQSLAGWFCEDFTLAEIKTLRATERFAQLRPANTALDGQFEIVTLAEIIALVQRRSREIGRPIGLYPETKHPAHFAAIGLPLEKPLVDALHAAGYRGAGAPVFLQSFDKESLIRLAGLTDLPRVFLSGKALAAADLAEIARFASGVGLAKNAVIPRVQGGALGAPGAQVADAHAAGLLVHVWTFRNEPSFLPRDLATDPDAELDRFLQTGIDGVFTDYPDTAAALVRRTLRAA